MDKKVMLEQLEESMKACEQEYNTVLQQLEQLAQRKEQIRGQFTAYNNLYQRLVSEETPETKAEQPVSVKEETTVKEDNKKTTTKKQTKKEEEQIKEIINLANNTKQPRPEDIPDYLKSEYTK